jgi:hypothetical protein
MTEKTRENAVSGGIALGSLFFLLWVIPTFTPAYPGYGVSSALLPNAVVGIILALSVLQLVMGLVSQHKAKSSDADKDQLEDGEIPSGDKIYLWHFASFMIPCILLFPALKFLTFIPGAFLFLALIQYLCGQRNIRTLVIVSACTTAVIYLAMVYGLGVPLP